MRQLKIVGKNNSFIFNLIIGFIFIQNLELVKDLLSYYIIVIQEGETMVNAQQIAPGTLKNYLVRLKTIKEYLAFKNQLNITPREVTMLWCKLFETWLLCHKKHSPNYANKHLQHLGKCLSYAHMDETISNNVMSCFKFKYDREAKIEYLTIGELNKLEQHAFTGVLERVRDLYVFSCYTGLGYTDLMRFDVERDVVLNQYGIFIAQKRGKTQHEAIIPVLRDVEVILRKYNNKLPKMTNQSYNKFLKRVLKEIHINRELGTHSARKTFGMMMHNHYHQPLDTVSKMLGHKSIRTTQRWYVKTDFKKIATDMKIVTSKLAARHNK